MGITIAAIAFCTMYFCMTFQCPFWSALIFEPITSTSACFLYLAFGFYAIVNLLSSHL
jgi:hypothetical protein